MNYCIGIDIGTTATKALAFSEEGAALAQHTAAYPMLHPEADYSEQDPRLLWQAVVECLNAVFDRCRNWTLQGVSFSTAMHSLLPLDAHKRPLGNILIWADNRAGRIADDLRQTEQGRLLFQRTGTPVHAMSPLVKLMWLRQNQADLWANTACFHDIKSFIFNKITNRSLVDYSIASASGLMNLRDKKWEKEALYLAGVSKAQLPILVSPRQVVYFEQGLCPLLRLPAGTPLVIGASDGCLANLGMGALHPGELAVTIGTSGAARCCIPTSHTDPDMRVFCYYLDENRYITGGGTNSGAVVLQWLKDQVLGDEQPFDDFLNQAAQVPPGAGGLLFLPYLLGERAPLWNAALRGAFVGLDIRHGRVHLIRAAMEGVVFQLFTIGEILAERTPLHKIIAGGGFAKNALWLQILADVFQLPVEVPDVMESSALGAVILGRNALGLPAMPQPETGTRYMPDKSLANLYEARVQAFKKSRDMIASTP